VDGDCLIFYHPLRGNTASSLFRPRRDILAVFDGVFYWSNAIVILREYVDLESRAMNLVVIEPYQSSFAWL
jgi:hypothetical protein